MGCGGVGGWRGEGVRAKGREGEVCGVWVYKVRGEGEKYVARLARSCHLNPVSHALGVSVRDS